MDTVGELLRTTEIHVGTIARFIVCLSLGTPPLTGAVAGAMFAGIGAIPGKVAITEDFVRDVAGLIKPGTSVVSVLDETGDMDVILHSILGVGRTVLKTNVDLERAMLRHPGFVSGERDRKNGRMAPEAVVNEIARRHPGWVDIFEAAAAASGAAA